MTGSLTLGEVAQFINGAAFKPEDWGEVGLPIIRIQNLTDSRKPYNRTLREVSDNLRVRRGDLLVSWSATLGVFTWDLEEDGLLNQHIFRVLPDESRVDRSYLRFALEEAINAMGEHLHGATMQHVNRGAFMGTRVPLPPLPEQRRIATILDQADGLRTKRRRALTLLDELADSLFVSEFGRIGDMNPSSLSKLGSVATIKSGSTPDRSKKSYFEGTIPWVKTTEVRGEVIYATQESVTEAGKTAARLQVFPEGSIVIAMYGQGATRGRSAVLGVPSAVNQACAVILPNEKFETTFMSRQLRLAYDRLRDKARGGNQANLNLGLVGDLDIILPSRKAQEVFGAKQRKLDQARVDSVGQIGKLDELFSSLQHRAFRGEL